MLQLVALFVIALGDLHRAGAGQAADAIVRRIEQPQPKLKLTFEQGARAAVATRDLLARARFVALVRVMPRSTVELARATRERGVTVEEAEAIAAYLVQLVDAVDFARLATFDENHSHVTGRRWPEIDYTGEGMTWQSQQAYWAPRGVADFRTAKSIHAYMVGAEQLEHWRRVYKPRNAIPAAVQP